MNILKKILKIIKNWIVKDDYENEKPDPKSFYLAKSKYYKYETFIIGIENTIAGYEALKNITPLIYINVQDISTKILFKNKDVFLFNNSYTFIILSYDKHYTSNSSIHITYCKLYSVITTTDKNKFYKKS